MPALYSVNLRYKSDWSLPDSAFVDLQQSMLMYKAVLSPDVVKTPNKTKTLDGGYLINISKSTGLTSYSDRSLPTKIFHNDIAKDRMRDKLLLKNGGKIILESFNNPRFLDKVTISWQNCGCARHQIYEAKFTYIGETPTPPSYTKFI